LRPARPRRSRSPTRLPTQTPRKYQNSTLKLLKSPDCVAELAGAR
jgi:hypothetical protein